MTQVFADTFYFLALINSDEDRHAEALKYLRNSQINFLTTEWVLLEFADAYSSPKDRSNFVALYRFVVQNSRFKIIAADTQLFQRGMDFFGQRRDKEWSLSL
jgi:predicted nucleic acid-binding protein